MQIGKTNVEIPYQLTIKIPSFDKRTLPPGNYSGNITFSIRFYSAHLIEFLVGARNCDSPPDSSIGIPLNFSFVVTKWCSISDNNLLDFGSLDATDVVQSSRDVTANIRVNCNPTTDYTVYLGGGEHFLNGERRMKHVSNNDFISYKLYKDSSSSAEWNNGGGPLIIGSSGGVSGKGDKNTSDQNLTIYGRIPPQHVAPTPGDYRDNVKITVTY